MRNNADIRDKANRYMELETPYAGETKVIHYLEMLRDDVTFFEIAKKVKHPLKSMRLAAYYGCMLLRPSDVMQFDDPENPSIMEDLIKAMGAAPVETPYRNECCGAYVSLHNKKLADRKCDLIHASAIESGADAIMTACPLCMYNLSVTGMRQKLPVYYFTEVLAQALGIKQQEAADAAV
jgi:heterodisulfide reductase subunit B